MKDDDAFLNWAGTIPDSEIITQESEEHGTLYGFLFGTLGDSGGIPNHRYVDDQDYDLDIYKEIQEHLATGWSITFMEAGAEKLRYITGAAAVVTPKEIEHYDLHRWVSETLNGLGDPKSTACEY
jgi:hypothetical protein